MKLLFIPVFAGILLMAGPDCTGQIIFVNKVKEPVMVALAQFTITPSGGSWTTRGWFTVNPGIALTAFTNIQTGDSIGYWAMSSISETIYEGTRNLLVHNDEKFTVKDAGNELVKMKHPEFEWRKFRLVLLSPGVVKGTVRLEK